MIVIIPECQECKRRRIARLSDLNLVEFDKKYFPHAYETAVKEAEQSKDEVEP